MLNEVDTAQFNAMCAELARMAPGVPEATVVKSEASRVLHRASALTPVAKAAAIRERVMKGHYMRFQGQLYYLGNVYPDALWGAIVSARKQRLQDKLRARGLARQSWYIAAMRMGKPFDAPAYVKAAVASTGREYPNNIEVQIRATGSEYSIAVINAQPTVTLLPGSERSLASALAARVVYFETNLRRKVFENVERTAAKYRGFYTTP